MRSVVKAFLEVLRRAVRVVVHLTHQPDDHDRAGNCQRDKSGQNQKKDDKDGLHSRAS